MRNMGEKARGWLRSEAVVLAGKRSSVGSGVRLALFGAVKLVSYNKRSLPKLRPLALFSCCHARSQRVGFVFSWGRTALGSAWTGPSLQTAGTVITGEPRASCSRARLVEGLWMYFLGYDWENK